MKNKKIVEKFYNAFLAKDADKMKSCYHKNIIFEDPAFGMLKGKEVGNMWQMLLSNKNSDMKVEYAIAGIEEDTVTVLWTAKYLFGKKRRPVTNHVRSKLTIQNNLIIGHQDEFGLWNWSRQALGWPGWLLGWTPFMAKTIKNRSRAALKAFVSKKSLKE